MKRLVIFAHYDGQSEVKRYIVQHLRAIREHCDRLVFVSTSPLSREEMEKLEGTCAEIILRENVGFDFGMWRDAIDRADLAAWDELVLTNSSVFGPLHPLGPIFERMAEEPVDLWGMTENVELGYHIQSYFLAFRRSLIEAPIFRQFWASVLPFKDKDQVIRSYEIGLSRLLLDHGFRLKACFPTASLSIPRVFPRLSALRENGLWTALREGRVNPTCGYPVELIRAGMPYVKAELLRDNPCYAELDPVLQAMEETGFDMSLVEFDRPVKRQGTPPPVLGRLARRG